MAKMTESEKAGMRPLDIEFIESWEGDLGWLMLDYSDIEKQRLIEENKKNDSLRFIGGSMMQIVKTKEEAIRRATRLANEMNEVEHGNYYRVLDLRWAKEVHVINEHKDVYQIYQY